MNPSWVYHDDDVGFRLGDLTYHPLGAPCYDPLLDWVDDDDDDDGFHLGDPTCHPLGVPLWLSHRWMNSNWVADVDRELMRLLGFTLTLWKNSSSMKLNWVDDVGFHLHKLLTYHPLECHCDSVVVDEPNLSWMMLLGFTLVNLTCHPFDIHYDTVIWDETPTELMMLLAFNLLKLVFTLVKN